MPQGYYTIEQWKRPDWVAIATLPFGLTQTAAEEELQRLGKPGFYRLVQTQRVIWAERDGKSLRLRKSHASSPASLDGMREMFERSGGSFPVEEIRTARKQMKQNRPARKKR